MASTYPFKKATATRIVFPILDADGDPVPDATDLDSQYSIDGAQFIACTDEAHNIANPGGATNTGLYYLDLTSGEMNGDKIAVQVKTSSSGAKTTMLVIYTSGQTDDETKTVLDGVAADYAKTGEAAAASSQGEAATFSAQGEAAAASSQGEAAAALASWISSYEGPLMRILGLVQENQKITSPVFDADDHMTSCTITVYTDATLTVPLAAYNMTATYDVNGNLASYQVVKV